MPLELLQDALRIETRITIVKPGDEAERHYIVLAAVNPGAAIFFGRERPAQGVNHLARRDAASGNFPELLYALAVGLRVTIPVKSEPGYELRAKVVILAEGTRGSKFDLGWFCLSTPLSSVRTPVTRWLLFSPLKSSSDPANPVKIVMPVSSTLRPSHFTNRFNEMT